MDESCEIFQTPHYNSTFGHCNLTVASEGNDSIYLHYTLFPNYLGFIVLKITRAGDTLYTELLFLFYFCRQLNALTNLLYRILQPTL